MSDQNQVRSFRSRIARGGAILTAAVGFERAMRLARSVALAKLIAPADMGLVTLCAVVLTVFETAGEAGIRLSVIQNKQGDEPGFLNAAWWFQSLRGLGLTILGVLLAGVIAGFLNKPELTSLLRAAFLAVAFNAMVSPASFLLEKHLRFGRYVILNQGTMLLGTALTVTLAVWMRNAWPMIIGVAAEGMIKLILSFVMCPFTPYFPIDRQALGKLFAFARGLMGMPLLSLAALYADVLVLGRMVSIAEVGFYGMAAMLTRIPRDIAMQIVGKLLLPAFSARQEHTESLSMGLMLSSRWMTLATAPLAVFFAVWASPILVLASRPEYAAAAGAFAVLAGAVFFRAHGVILWNFYIAAAQLKQNRTFTIVRVVIIAALIVPLVKGYGMAGAAWAVLLGEAAGFILQVAGLRRRIPSAPAGYLKNLVPGLILAVIAGICGVALRFLPQASLWTQLAAGLGILAAVYLTAGYFEYPQIRDFLKKR
jgi:O-antigen/teichoic acid export membrane protein